MLCKGQQILWLSVSQLPVPVKNRLFSSYFLLSLLATLISFCPFLVYHNQLFTALFALLKRFQTGFSTLLYYYVNFESESQLLQQEYYFSKAQNFENRLLESRRIDQFFFRSLLLFLISYAGLIKISQLYTNYKFYIQKNLNQLKITGIYRNMQVLCRILKINQAYKYFKQLCKMPTKFEQTFKSNKNDLYNNLQNIFIKQKMGQIHCCQSDLEHNQLVLNYNNNSKILDPQQTAVSDILRKSVVTNTLIAKRGFQNGVDGDYITQDPSVTEAVYNRLANLHSLNIHQSHFLVRGDQEHSYFRIRRTGVIYAGQWKNGAPNGLGKNYYPNGGVYEGSFIDGIPHGYGRFIMPNGDYYQGQVKFGRANGFGIYETDTSSYKGNFKDNVRHGKGQQKGKGYLFVGQYQYGEKKSGMYKYNGNVYQGQYMDDLFNGKGTLTTSQGIYSGDFKDGQQSGYGQFKWANGSYYRGNYFKGLRQGYGQYFNGKDSSISKGIWKKGVLNGQGEYVQPMGQTHKCVWSDGKITAVIQK